MRIIDDIWKAGRRRSVQLPFVLQFDMNIGLCVVKFPNCLDRQVPEVVVGEPD